MIEVKGIKKAFNGKEVLKGIDVTFQDGKVNMIIGSSGTGKSVLLKVIVGLIKPDTGYVKYDGTDFYSSDLTTQKQIRGKIGMLFQGSALFDSKTVTENVRFPLDMRGSMTEAEKKDRVEFCLERVGLSQAADRMPSEISGGMQKRVGIARAIVNRSEYLFCDEPNSGLDPNTAIVIDELIQEITQEDKLTTVVVSHDLNSVLGIGENILFLAEGHKIWEGNNVSMLEPGNPEKLNEFLFTNKLMEKFKND
jgi:phospholipid/cholesterol/gamma-HCH transport system ATP-binding protein